MTETGTNYKVYKDGNKLVRPTGELVPQFEGVIIAVYEGDSPKTVSESLRAVHELEGLPEVDLATLSVPWRVALGLPQGVAQSKCATSPASGSVIGNRSRGSSPSRRSGAGRTQIVKTHYVKVNHQLGWLALISLFVMVMLVTACVGVNLHFVLMVSIGCIMAILYALSAIILAGTSTEKQI